MATTELLRSLNQLLYPLCSIMVVSGVFAMTGQLDSTCLADSPVAPKCYALLIAVDKYEDAKLNQPQLLYPQADAQEIGKFLETGGYVVEYLLGPTATRQAILSKLEAMNQQGNQEGAVVLGFFGHGVEYSGTDEAMFCPYDSRMRFAKDADGKQLYETKENGGAELMEPDPASLVGMADILRSLKICKAGNKLLLADCCRKSPNAARGRAFGSTVSLSDLPNKTAALFACSTGEEAQEHPDWNHGAMTRSFLELLPELIGDQNDINAITGRMSRAVAKLVNDATNGRKKQTLNPIVKGIVELRLNVPKTDTNPAEIINSLGMSLKLIPAGEFLMGSNETIDDLAVMGFELYLGFENSDERPQHNVEIRQPFYLGAHETTLGQFLEYYNSAPEKHRTDAERNSGATGFDLKTGKLIVKSEYRPWKTGWNEPIENYMDHPVVNVSWNDAIGFCTWLTEKERKLGLITPIQEYRLPSEAQWEYACRGGTLKSTLFSFGNDTGELVKYANIRDKSAKQKFGEELGIHHDGHDDAAFTAKVGSYTENQFGLFDMHGNVWEWCEDMYDPNQYANHKYSARDPVGLTAGIRRVRRGGSWYSPPVFCRSSDRGGDSQDYLHASLGFRISLQQIR